MHYRPKDAGRTDQLFVMLTVRRKIRRSRVLTVYTAHQHDDDMETIIIMKYKLKQSLLTSTASALPRAAAAWSAVIPVCWPNNLLVFGSAPATTVVITYHQ